MAKISCLKATMYVYNQNEFYMATCINCDKTETAMGKNSILKAKCGLLLLLLYINKYYVANC